MASGKLYQYAIEEMNALLKGLEQSLFFAKSDTVIINVRLRFW